MTTWLNARDLYKSLAIPAFPLGMDFTAWFERWVEGEYKINNDWIVTEKRDFLITQRVYDEISAADKGPPVERMRHYHRTAEFAKSNRNQPLSQQTHAITEDEE